MGLPLKEAFYFSTKQWNYYYGGTYDREQIHHKIDDVVVENSPML